MRPIGLLIATFLAAMSALLPPPANCQSPSGAGAVDPTLVVEPIPSLLIASGSLRSLAVAGDGRLFVLDADNDRVVVFDTSGALLTTFGRSGRGPGEFSRPSALALGDSLLVVGDRNSRFTIFGLDGSYRNSFVIPRIRFMNSDLVVVGDSLVAVGGFVEGAGKAINGRLLHLVTIDGLRVGDAVPLSQSALDANSFTVSGASVALQHDSLWVIQPTEYTLSRVGLDGSETTRTLSLRPEYYRPPVRKEPPVSRTAEWTQWLRGFDHPQKVFALNDSMVVVSVVLMAQIPSRYSIDFINTRSGEIVYSFIDDERVCGVDTTNNTLFFEGEYVPDEQMMEVRRYRVVYR